MAIPAPPLVAPLIGTPPNRGQSEDEFNTNQQNFVDYQVGFVPDVNALATWMDDTATTTEDNALSAETDANAAAESAQTAVDAASSAINAPGTNATSTSTITPAMGANAFTLAQTGKTFVVGQFVTVANSPTNFFTGQITAFNSGTGAITVDGRTVESTGSASAWTITASAPAQGERFKAPVQTSTALGNVSGTVNLDLRIGLDWSMTLTGNTTLTFTMPDLFATGLSTEVSLLVTKGGSYSLIMPVGTEYSDGTAPNPTSGTKNEYIGTRRSGSNWIFALGRKNIA